MSTEPPDPPPGRSTGGPAGPDPGGAESRRTPPTGPAPPSGAAGRGGRVPPGGRPLLVELHTEMRAFRADLSETQSRARAATSEIAELLPRVGDLETTLGVLLGRLDGLLPAGDADNDTAGPAPVSTPAMGWAELSTADAATAWQALGDWVAGTLCGSYWLTRVQLPDCWPVHPRAVLELAWLRTMYLVAVAHAARHPGSVAEWHTRWLPATITNLATTIDPLECAPGRHRLTEYERGQHEDALDKALRAESPAPTVTTETGAGRPRYLPDRFPPRRDRFVGPPREARVTRPESLDPQTSPAPRSTRDCWLDYYHDAVAEDLARREQRDREARAQSPASGQQPPGGQTTAPG